ncbi:hypothetical protein Drorol1_Dr00021039 [Drosera rotundifolia]
MMDFLDLMHLLLLWISTRFLRFIFRRKSKIILKNVPPGPYMLTYMRNMSSLVTKPHKYFADLAESYGPLMSIQLGFVTTVVVSSASLAREVLQKNDAACSYRSRAVSFSILNEEESVVAFLPPNAMWKSLRRMFKAHMFNASKLESTKGLRREKLQELIAFVQHRCEFGSMVTVREAVFTTSLNVLSNVFFSIDVADPRCDRVDQGEFWELVWAIGKVIGKPNVADYIPILKLIDPQGITRRTSFHVRKAIKILDALIAKRLRSREEKSYVEDNHDVLDDFITICQEQDSELKLSHIPHVILELFVGGTDTTSSTVEWAMAELLHSPEKLKKAQAELEEVIGKGNLVEEDDIDRLPYLKSVVKETFRLHPSVPFLVPRKVITDVDLCGYTVPKNAQVLVNVWAIGRDESFWEDGNEFLPERFINRPDIDVKGHSFELLPFGAGRRTCPGMHVGYRMVHCVLGSLIHSFDWKLEDGITPQCMDINDTFGFALRKAQPLRAFPCRKV